MSSSILKYEHIAISRTVCKGGPCPDRSQHDRRKKLLEYIKNNTIIKRDVIEKMSYRNVDYALKMFTKNRDTKFIPIDYDTWEKNGDVNYKKMFIGGTRKQKLDSLVRRNKTISTPEIRAIGFTTAISHILRLCASRTGKRFIRIKKSVWEIK
jgi:hypothetical protein